MRELAFLDASVTYVSLADHPLPIYDPDAASEPPAGARKLAGFFRANHAVFLATAEIYGSIAPLLLNAIDWVAAVPPDRRSSPIPLVVLAVTSATERGGPSALSHLRDVVAAAFGAVVVGSIGVGSAPDAFDDKGRLVEPDEAKALQNLARDAVFMARRLAAEP